MAANQNQTEELEPIHSSAEIDAELQAERDISRYAIGAAIAAGILIPAGLIWLVVVSGDAPSNNAPSLLRFFHHHATPFVLSRIVSAIGLACLAPVAIYLWRVTSFRRPEAPRAIVVTGVVGSLLAAVATVIAAVVLLVGAGDFVQRDYQTIDAAKHVFATSGRGVTAIALVAGTLSIGIWLVLTSLHAMRAGLLTRQMGFIGIALGPLFVLSGSGLPPIQILMGLWLIALGVLFAGYWPGGRPQAWQSGTAIPWPSAAERQAQLKKLKNASKTET